MIKFKQSPINIKTSEVIEVNRNVHFDYNIESFEVKDTGLNISLTPHTSNNYIIKDGRRFDLIELHFHRPSEHTINSESFDMELHLVHKGNHENLVYSVLLKIEDEGFEFGSPFSNINNTISFDLNRLLPVDCWDYHGSLTTSPFDEVVIWLINQKLMTIQTKQANLINDFYPNNNRCLQPLNDRDVYTICSCNK